MTMVHGEKLLRDSDDPRDAAYANMIAAILASRGEDIPLPESAPHANVEVREAMGGHALVGARFPGEEKELGVPSIEGLEHSGQLAAEIQTMPHVVAGVLMQPL